MRQVNHLRISCKGKRFKAGSLKKKYIIKKRIRVGDTVNKGKVFSKVGDTVLVQFGKDDIKSFKESELNQAPLDMSNRGIEDITFEQTKHARKWIQGAKLKKGGLSKQLSIPEDKNIPMGLLDKIVAATPGDTIKNDTAVGKTRIKVTRKMEQRAILARNLKRL